MNRLTVLAWGLLAASLAAAGGCTPDCPTQLANLQRQYDALLAQNKELARRAQDAEGRSIEMQTRMEQSDRALRAAQTELDALKARGPVAATGAGGGGVPTGWTPTATGARKEIGSDILFGPGQATLTARGLNEIKEIAAAIKSHYPTGLVRVYGYTDADPVVKTAKLWQDNLDLSSNRANAVTRQIEKLGIPGSRIESVGMGQWHPLAPNTTPANKSKNRRVEIVVVK